MSYPGRDGTGHGWMGSLVQNVYFVLLLSTVFTCVLCGYNVLTNAMSLLYSDFFSNIMTH